MHPAADLDPKQANIVYHDWEAQHYDDKWSISFDQRCIDYALGRFRKIVTAGTPPFRDVLEVGAGTGFFSLNLAQAGVLGDLHVTDISAGMVQQCIRNGARLGIAVHGRQADAADLDCPDAAFDLVLGHAVVHHVPDLERAFAEWVRVLRPGGRLLIAGEPTLLGDAVANQVKRAARLGVRAAGALLGSERLLRPHLDGVPEAERDAAGLETVVDQHVFTPRQLEALATGAGLVDVRTVTEELTANWFGWATRTVEAMLRPGVLPAGYPYFAYGVWRRLFWMDEHVWRRLAPKTLYYNCILSGLRPDAPAGAR